MIQEFNKINKVKGELKLSGDKSISHRAVFFASMSDGKSVIRNLSNSVDVNSTMDCFSAMGAEVKKENQAVVVKGRGFKGFKRPVKPLDAGNSGTTARLIIGVLASQNFESVLIGDEFLSKRPMDRIVIPLRLMGAKIESKSNTLPLKIYPVTGLNPINYELPIPSAQIKSAVILAGLHCDGMTTVTEFIPSRDHTEKMLGLEVRKNGTNNTILVSKKNYPVAAEYFVPSDVSSAAFFVVLTLLTKNSSLKIKNVSLNDTRTGYLKILKRMGAKLYFENNYLNSGEPIADVIIENSPLVNIDIPGDIIPNIIDEIPILSVAGLFAEGDFTIRGASELRKKESDRINSLCHNYRLLGLDVKEFEDGFTLSGEIKNKNVVFESFHDHRIAMAFGILSLLLNSGGKVDNFDCVKISNPDFIKQIKSITG